MDPTKIKDYLSQVGLVGVLGAILWLGSNGTWVWGSDYKKLEADRDQWKVLALRGTELAESALPKAVGMAPPANPGESVEDVASRLRNASRALAEGDIQP